jgi:hypothetical protein
MLEKSNTKKGVETAVNILGHASIGGLVGLMVFFFLIKRDKYVSGFGYNGFFAATVIFMLLFCTLAVLPDIGHLWGDANTDQGDWNDIFFFAKSIDVHANVMERNYRMTLEFLLLSLTTLMFSSVLTYRFNNYDEYSYRGMQKRNMGVIQRIQLAVG